MDLYSTYLCVATIAAAVLVCESRTTDWDTEREYFSTDAQASCEKGLFYRCLPKAAIPQSIALGNSSATIYWELIRSPKKYLRGPVMELEIRLKVAGNQSKDHWKRVKAFHGSRAQNVTRLTLRGLGAWKKYVVQLRTSNQNGVVKTRTWQFSINANEYIRTGCKPRKQVVTVGQRAHVLCTAEGGPDLEVKYLPSDEMRSASVNTKSVSELKRVLNINISKVRPDMNGKKSCIQVRTRDIRADNPEHPLWKSLQSCFELIVKPAGNSPRPIIESSSVAENWVTVRWDFNSSQSSSAFSTRVKIVGRNKSYFFSTRKSDMSLREHNFSNLQPGRQYKLTVITQTKTSTARASIEVTTRRRPYITCHSAAVHSAPQPVTCEYGGYPAPNLVIPRGFLVRKSGSHFKLLVAADDDQLTGKQCVAAVLNGDTEQACFNVENVQRGTPVCVRTDIRGRSSPRVKVRCLISGSPSPDWQNVHITLDGKPVNLTSPPKWLIRSLSCKFKNVTQSPSGRCSESESVSALFRCNMRVNKTILLQQGLGRIGCHVSNGYSTDESYVQVRSRESAGLSLVPHLSILPTGSDRRAAS